MAQGVSPGRILTTFTKMQYQEIGGSPKEQYGLDVFKAQRVFLVPWEDREQFADTVFGTTSSPSTVLTYPGREKTVAVRLKMEPFDPNAIGISPLNDLRTDLSQYDGSFLKATIDYESAEGNDRDDS